MPNSLGVGVPSITDRSTKVPLLNLQRISHGTLECNDLARTRRFYEEVLGIECIQTSPRSLMIRFGTDHTYAVVEMPKEEERNVSLLNHNGLDVGSEEEVRAAYELLLGIKDEWGLKKVMQPSHSHGDTSFYFCDFDGNWWEIVAVRPGGYVRDFHERDQGYDLTGHHEYDRLVGNVNYLHTHDPEFRERLLGGK